MKPTSKAATTVPSRTPSMPPNMKSDTMQAEATSEQSKPIFTQPNSFFHLQARVLTKASPHTITTLATTSRLTPKPRMTQPTSRDTICQA